MSVFRPILPPKANYVEVLDENGEHVYKPTPQYQAQLDAESAKESRIAELEKENKLLKAQAKMADEQMSFLEDCLLEMADIVYA